MSDRSTTISGQQALLSAASVFMVGMMLGHPAHAAPGAPGVPAAPWLNQPAIEKTHAAPAPVRGARPCASNDLQVVAGPTGAYRGNATQEIRLTNIGAEACHLVGFPNTQVLPAGEAPQTVGAHEQNPQLANERVDLAPGEEVVMLIGTPGACDAAAGPQRKVNKRVQLALPGGGLKVLEGVHIDTLCGRASVLKFHPVHNEAAANARAAKAGPSLSQLNGSLSAPAEQVRGSTLHYTVTLTNPTATPIPLSPCPAYTQSIYAEGKIASSTLRLNCGAVGAQIAPNSAVSFDMQAQVPADLPAGGAKLSWKLEDGPGAGTILSLR
jgi:hypothetical protein